MGEMMVVWEGRVRPDKQDALLAAYRNGAGEIPPGMTRHLILQDSSEPEIFRLVSFWESPAVLDEYRSQMTTPAALQMFRAAGVEPTRTISEALDE